MIVGQNRGVDFLMTDDTTFYLDRQNISIKSQRNLRILELLRRHGSLSRTDISKESGINPVTVSHYVDKLISRKIVYEKEYDISSGGRRPLLLGLNPSSGYTIGISFNVLGVNAVVVDLDGNVKFRHSDRKRISSINDFIDSLVNAADYIYENTREIKDKIQGIGIGLGGIVDEENQVIRWPAESATGVTYSYVSMPVKNYFKERFNAPVFVGNDANLACFAEHWLCMGQDVRNVLYMYSGVSCGIMVNGELYKGKQGCIGELFINVPEDSSTSYGDYSFFRQWQSDLGIIDKVNSLILSQKHEISRVTALEEAFSLAIDGVQEILNDAAVNLGIKIALLVNVLNPDVVVIGGGMEKGGYTFIEKISESVKKHAFEEMVRNLKIIPSALGDEATALGAANMAVRNVFAAV